MKHSQSKLISPRAPALVVRSVWSIALVTIVPALAIAAHIFLKEALPGPTGVAILDDDESRFNLIIASVSVVAAILIWRRFIIWTMGRKALTALIGLIPFVQVVAMQPLWPSGCGGSITLELCQQEVAVGLWIWLCIWAWWGLELSADHVTVTWRRWRMTSGGKRVLCSLGSIPLIVGCFGILWQAWDDFTDLESNWAGTATFLCASVLAVTVWMLIWRGQVEWSRRVSAWTMLLAAALIALTIGPMPWLWGQNGYFSETCVTFPIIAWGVWMAATVAMWPMKPSPQLQASRIPMCPACGYALVGLKHTRCPECGSEPTLDEIWKASHDQGI